MKSISATLAISLACAAGCSVLKSNVPPPPVEQNLVLDAPITAWADAIPLGNGLTGGLLWGEGNLMRLSLDRGDLWDERTTGEPEWWKKYPWSSPRSGPEWGKIWHQWNNNYNGPTPTKLPGGRLEITFPKAKKLSSFELKLAAAEGVATFTDQTQARTFFDATEPVAMMRFPGDADCTLRPAGTTGNAVNASSMGAVTKLGYPAAEHGSDGSAKWFVQKTLSGLQYCVCLETKRVGDETLMALSITSTSDLGPGQAGDVLALARQRCAKALANGYDAQFDKHTAWWREFWGKSSVTIPEAKLQRHYQFVRYLYGAGSRRNAPPMPLQGVWTADNGGLPPWKGDYHNDLNTQTTYIAYYESGDFDAGLSYLDYLWDLRPTFQKFAKDFYGTDGLSTPGVMSFAGQPLGGWPQYSLSPTMTAWNAHLFYLHWLYTND